MPVTFQINVAPPDVRHAHLTLPHMVRVWVGQVDEVLFTYDTAPPSRGRFAEDWERHRPAMDLLLDRLCQEHPKARVGEVDPGQAARREVAVALLDAQDVPLKDSRGGPLYSYLYGLHDATHDLVLHADSDMLFGGASQTWIAEATALLDDREDVLLTAPLPGPPHPDGLLFDQPEAVPVPGHPRSYTFETMTTRVFFLRRSELRRRLGPLRLMPPLLRRSRVKAAVNRHPPYAMPEQMMSRSMQAAGQRRIDFLGAEPGMWSLHPAARSPNFYAGLPQLVERVERADMPAEQLGVYDVGPKLIDWSDVTRPGPLKRLLT